jgi:hypothetical protein
MPRRRCSVVAVGERRRGQAGFSKTGGAAARSVPLVTSNARLARLATFHARSGDPDRLVERLLHGAGLAAETPGCKWWLVHRDQRDPDRVRVSGARMLRGTTGAPGFSILDAPDLSQDTELPGRDERDRVGEARDVRVVTDWPAR